MFSPPAALQKTDSILFRRTATETPHYRGRPVRSLSIAKHGGFCGYLAAGWRPEKWVPSTACHRNRVWSFLECNPIESAYAALNLKTPFSFPMCIRSSYNAISVNNYPDIINSRIFLWLRRIYFYFYYFYDYSEMKGRKNLSAAISEGPKLTTKEVF